MSLVEKKYKYRVEGFWKLGVQRDITPGDLWHVVPACLAWI